MSYDTYQRPPRRNEDADDDGKISRTYRLSAETRRQLSALTRVHGDMTSAIEAAVAREYAERIGTIGVSREEALREAMDNPARRAIVAYDDGSFDAVPPAHLTDVTWCGRGHVVTSAIITEIVDITGDDGRRWDELDDDERSEIVRHAGEE